MRLLDLIAQAREPFLVEHGESARTFRLQGALDLAPQVLFCPVRYVLSDELAALCAELAYSSGDRLIRCLDLVRFPAPQLWIEWSDSAALAGASGFFGEAAAADTEPDRRVGVLVQGTPEGTRALLRAFWSEQDQAIACPMEALLDLRQGHPPATAGQSMYRDWVRVTETIPAVAQLLDCARFRLEPSWAGYYEQAVVGKEQGYRALCDSLTGIARDVPVLIAFLLLLASREAVAVRPVNWDALNHKRARQGRVPLLNHLEARLALAPAAAPAEPRERAHRSRFAPRRHQVRGHLVRHRNCIYWRRPHYRGNAFHGRVLSRTVRLSFEHGAGQPA
jgi:hypothetical protein